MAFIQCDFHSSLLNLGTSMNVILPRPADAAAPSRTLYLLHGFAQDHTLWCRQTSIERYAEERGLAVVMPEGHHSFWADMAAGGAYGRYIEEELPAVTRSLFPLSHRREDTFICGLSMGGYGALRAALRRPDVFSAVGSLSGAADIALLTVDATSEWKEECERIFGRLEGIRGSGNDLFTLADRLDEAVKRSLRLYQCCGTEDVLLAGNRTFRDHATRGGLDLTYEEGPGGHDWSYWDRKVQDFLDWLTGAPAAAGAPALLSG
jgi:S-formylglutathione hydrolase FrmB